MSLENEKTHNTQPDMLKLNTEYAITINPDDNLQCFDDSNRIHKVIVKTKRILYKLQCEYILYPEISHPMNTSRTSGPRVHFHGVIKFDNIYQLIRWYDTSYTALKKSTYFDMDTIEDRPAWIKYCTKNKKLMKKICKTLKLEYPILSTGNLGGEGA